MSRAEDVRIEQVCGKFLDENFYSKLGCKFERNSVLSSQYLGVDVTIWSQHSTFVIDEKVKYYGTINKAIDCPSFEITRRDRAGNRGIGWYASGKQLTNTDSKTATDAKPTFAQQLSQKVNAIMTSGKTTGEMLAAIAALYPAFSREGGAE